MCIRDSINAVRYQVGYTQQIWERFFLDALNRALQGLIFFGCVDSKTINYAGQKSARSTGWVKDCFAQLWIDLLHNKAGNRARRIKLAGFARALQVFQHSFIPVSYTHLDVYKRQ